MASVSIIDDILPFLFIDDRGRAYREPFYWSLVNNEKPTAEKMLSENGLHDPNEIHYMIAYQCGAFPNGHPAHLLREFPSPQAAEFSIAIQRIQGGNERIQHANE